MNCDRSGGIDTLSIGIPVRVRKVIAGVFEILARLGHAGARRLQPLFGLLLVGDADRALGDAFAQVAGEPLVERRIVFGDRDQPLLQQIVDVGARDVERDEFRALLDARRGGVGARRLAADFRLAAAAVEQQLVDDQLAFDRPQRLVGDADRAAGRVAQVANAGRALDRNARVPQALGLDALFLGGRAVGDRLANFRIGVECRLDRVAQLDGIGRRRAQAAPLRERSSSSASCS